MFATEQSARTTLGRNHGRIGASIDKCNETVLKIHPSKVIDVGGGCGVVCFDAVRTGVGRRSDAPSLAGQGIGKSDGYQTNA